MKKKILFLIHDLGVGGAEKVLVNLVNHMDRNVFDITVISLFGGGVNEQFLAPHIHYRVVWKRTIRGNVMLMKLFSPEILHRICIKDHYDIEVAFLESPIARIISGCQDKKTKLVSWIHIEQKGANRGAGAFRSYEEALACYMKFTQVVCVSKQVKECFRRNFPKVKEPIILHNTVEADKIISLSNEKIKEVTFNPEELKVIGVGKITPVKGFDKLARIILKLREGGYPIHFYALGTGPDQGKIENFLQTNYAEAYYTFLGYQTNPYKFVSKCDLFVCASTNEGFSTAATEALILGIPVCTVDVGGMREMLGDNNEWGIITENNEQALYEGIKDLIQNTDKLKYYKEKAEERGKHFSTEETVKQVEDFLCSL